MAVFKNSLNFYAELKEQFYLKCTKYFGIAITSTIFDTKKQPVKEFTVLFSRLFDDYRINSDGVLLQPY